MTDGLQELCEAAIAAVREVGSFIRQAGTSAAAPTITAKAQNSFVTDIDVASEQKLVAALRQILPAAAFITEEDTVDNGARELAWVIDPIDGTTNFMHRVPCYAISVALLQDGAPVIGIVYEITLDECFYAIKGQGAYLNGEPIGVSRCEALSDALVATGFPYHDHSKVEALLNILRDLITGARGLRRFGSAAVDLAYVACGRFDAFYEHTLNIWDIAAGVLIVEEAGGTISDFNGADNYFNNGQVIAAPILLHPKLTALVKGHFFANK